MATSSIVIKDVDVDGRTGYIRIRVFTQNVDGAAEWSGPESDYGLDARMFAGRFGGDLEQVKTWLATEHAQYVGVHTELIQKLAALKGQKVG